MESRLIHSKILDDTICISDKPVEGHVCYSQKEIELLREIKKSVKSEGGYAYWLKKLHQVKKVFPGAVIQEINMKEAPTEPSDSDVRSQAVKPGVEGAEATPEPPIQKSMWEL